MEKYNELQFLYQVSIPGIEKDKSGYRMPCPYCKEGSSFGRKKRGHLLSEGNKYPCIWFFCQNCSVSLSFRQFIRDHQYSLYEEYVIYERKEKLEELKSGIKTIIKTEDRRKLKFIPLKKEFIPLIESQEGLAYCVKRKIPKTVLDKMFFNPKHKTIIFPLYFGEKIYGWQERSISKKYFHTHTEENYKIYNFFNIDNKKPVFIFESIIDSLFVKNSISSLGSDINSTIIRKIDDPIFCYDNDETGWRKTLKYIQAGYKGVIWPKNLKIKDVNQGIVENVFNRKKLMEIIENNVYEGFKGDVMLKMKLAF